MKDLAPVIKSFFSGNLFLPLHFFVAVCSFNLPAADLLLSSSSSTHLTARQEFPYIGKINWRKDDLMIWLAAKINDDDGSAPAAGSHAPLARLETWKMKNYLHPIQYFPADPNAGLWVGADSLAVPVSPLAAYSAETDLFIPLPHPIIQKFSGLPATGYTDELLDELKTNPEFEGFLQQAKYNGITRATLPGLLAEYPFVVTDRDSNAY